MNTLLQFLLGTWFICSTNFPMWLKGNKTHPTFNYSLAEGKGSNVLFDDVRFLKNGKQKSIQGYDYQDKVNDSLFVWRGKGLLRPLKSEWRVVMLDPEKNWMVIYFSKTLFTPEGVDIVSRTKDLTEDEIAHIKNEMLKDSVLKNQVSSLKNIYH